MPLAEASISVPQFTLSDLAVMIGILSAIGSAVLYIFGTKFIGRDAYEADRKEVTKQLEACHDALLLTSQAHRELKDVMTTLSANIKENTSVTHALDRRLTILETLSRNNE